jgi:hypothetical protein
MGYALGQHDDFRKKGISHLLPVQKVH